MPWPKQKDKNRSLINKSVDCHLFMTVEGSLRIDQNIKAWINSENELTICQLQVK
ncbi:hypothetical protein R6Q59_000013 [Mikania micrantha]